MSIIVPGFALSTKTPGSYLNVVLGGPGTSAGVAPIRLLMFGNLIGSNLTGASPGFTVTAGTAALNVPVQVYSVADARAKFGAGSELAIMAAAVFAQYPQANLWAVPTAEGSTASTGVITFTGTGPWTEAMTLRVVVNGRTCDVSVATGDSLTTIATNAATQINRQTDWPVTAQYSAGVLTLTAKHAGKRGTLITFRCFLIGSSTSAKATAGALAATLNGLTATLSGGAAVGGCYRLTGGSTEESLTTPLAAVASLRFHRYILAQYLSSAISAAVSQINTMAGVNTGLRQQVVAGSVDTAANAVTLASGQNAPRLQLAWLYNSDLSPGEIAAQVAAGRVAGDGTVGGLLPGESSDPAANLDGLRLATIPMPDATADYPTSTQIETALNNGVTPLAAYGTSGASQVVRSVTTRCQDASGNPNFAVLDTSNVTVPDYVADDLATSYPTDFAGFKVMADPSDGSQPKIPNVTTPNQIRAWIMKHLKTAEQSGIVMNVDAHAGDLAVALDGSTPGRVLADIPTAVMPGLHQFVANVRQLTS